MSQQCISVYVTIIITESLEPTAKQYQLWPTSLTNEYCGQTQVTLQYIIKDNHFMPDLLMK